MKKVIFSLLAVLSMLGMGSVQARNVSVDEAKTAGAYYMRQKTDLGKTQASDLELVYQINNERAGLPLCYFFNVGEQGWIIMTANTAFGPVIGYGDEGAMEVDCLPANMLYFVQSIADDLSLVQDDELATGKEVAEDARWTMLTEESMPKSSKANRRNLMNEQWDQEAPYNLYSPVVNGRRCPVGCVATALAQICHYYQYPVRPKGSKNYVTRTHELQMSIRFDTITFDYSLMPVKLHNGSDMEKKLQISMLGYALGVAVGMDYDPDGSGAISSMVPDNLKAYFKYKKGRMVYRDNVGVNSFLTQLRNELTHNRPVYMGGVSSEDGGRDAGGHAWVCSGYDLDDPDMYYMNWGWGGGTVNHYFNLRQNNMSANGYNFRLNQEIIVGMVPPQDSVAFEIGIDPVEESASLKPAYPNPATMTVALPYELRTAADMNIYSIDGKLVETRHLQAGDGEVVVDVRPLPAGIYIYRLNEACGKFMVE